MPQHSRQLNGFFITGSDTGVGKTWTGCQLIRQLATQHTRVKVRKPVESGCSRQEDNSLYAADGHELYQANGCQESIDIITPYRFLAALAPDQAAALEGFNLTLEHLINAATRNIDVQDLLIVEGAGGFFSPIASDGLNADLARELGLSVIIIVDDRLGAINQALMTIHAVKSEGLDIAAIILNQTSDQRQPQLDNLADLKARLDLPVYQCPFNSTLGDVQLI